MTTVMIVLAVAVGIACGRLTHGALNFPPQFQFAVFAVMLFGIGVQVGTDQRLWGRIREVGWSAFALPLETAVGTLGGAVCAALIMHSPLGTTAAVGAGAGWYSLTAILLNQLAGPSAGALAFIANVFREILSFLLIPFTARYFGGRIAIAFGGSTSMDTTLSVIVKHAPANAALLSFSSGVVVSRLVPFLVPLVYHL